MREKKTDISRRTEAGFLHASVSETHSYKETFELARQFSEQLKKGDVVCLDGDLGTGKTVFAKGIAAGLGIREPVVSPTFTIMQVYEDGRLKLYHFDVYRITQISEMDEIGYEECFFGDGVCLVEWAELIDDIIPENAIHVRIEKDINRDDEYRKISIN